MNHSFELICCGNLLIFPLSWHRKWAFVSFLLCLSAVARVCVCETQVETGMEGRWSQHTPSSHEEIIFQNLMREHADLFLLLYFFSGIVVANNVHSAVSHCVIATTTLIALITSKYFYSNVFCQSQTDHRFQENDSEFERWLIRRLH